MAQIRLLYLKGDIDFDPSKPVGGGGFGELFKGTHLDDGVLALKRLRSHGANASQKERDALIDEARLWRQLSHPNVLAFYGVHLHSWDDVYLVSPWVDNGSLTDYIATHPDADRPVLLHDAIEGLAYLHENGIVHGDLKGPNALVTSALRVVLCDFGLSKMAESANSSTGAKGTNRWQSPELMMGGPRTFKADIYAFGIMIYEILSGSVPFSTYISTAVTLAVVMRNERPPKEPQQSLQGISYAEYWRIAERCWEKAIDDRPTAAEVLKFWPSLETTPDERFVLQLRYYVLKPLLLPQPLESPLDRRVGFHCPAQTHDESFPILIEEDQKKSARDTPYAEAVQLPAQGILNHLKFSKNPALSVSDPEMQDRIALLIEAIALNREAVDLRPPGHPERVLALASLSDALRQAYAQNQNRSLFNEVITINRELLSLCPSGNPYHPTAVRDLGFALLERSNYESDISQAEEAISLFREQLGLFPPEHNQRVWFLGFLGSALLERARQEPNLPNLEEAIALNRETLALRPPGHPARGAALVYLNEALFRSYPYEPKASVVDELITINRELLSLNPPGHPHRVIILKDLGLSLIERSKHGRDLSDIEEAITFLREARETCPVGNPYRGLILGNLGSALTERDNLKQSASHVGEATTPLPEAKEVRPLGPAPTIPRPGFRHAIGGWLGSAFGSVAGSARPRYKRGA